VPSANGGVTQNQMVPPWLSPPGTGIPLIPRSAEIRGAQCGCDFPSFPDSVHPHSEFPCENGFEASQEMACSSSGPETFGCLWVCLYNTGTSMTLGERRTPSMTNCCQSLLSCQEPTQQSPLRRTLGIGPQCSSSSNPLLCAGSPTSSPGCPEPHPAWPRMPPGMGHPQPPWATCSCVSPLSGWKNFLLISNLNLPCLSLKPFPLVLSLSTLVNSHPPSCLYTPSKYWKESYEICYAGELKQRL